MSTIYEGDHYIVRALEGTDEKNIIVTSFTGVGAPERHDGTFFGYSLAKKLDLPWVGIIAKHDCWYRDGDYLQAFSAALHWVQTRKQTLHTQDISLLGYGVSMGAYAVIKYSRLFNFDYVISMAPQWSIDKSEVSHHSHFQNFFQPILKSMGIQTEDTHGKIYVFFDPYEKPDAEEVKLIQQKTPAFSVPVCHAGHMVTARLKGTKIFQKLVSNLDNPAAIRRIAARTRRNAPENIFKILRYAQRKSPLWFFRLLTSDHPANREILDHFMRHHDADMRALAADLARADHSTEATQLFHQLGGNYRQVFTPSYVLAWTGELLCYDIAEKAFLQTKHHIPERGAPVILNDDDLYAFTPAGLIPLACQTQQDGFCFSIHTENGHLSARPDGTVAPVSHVMDWEKFCVLQYQQT
ncbi:hypothetical protein JK205_02310 [Gluconobacter cerinus]|uniref:hypothetical protein n=1 Tax=Gluconobacter cerinus TaxID=38307 RepID=UPI001B8D1609|nr:hypothetical protein [Gluconobacter cerinus]MBS1017769.1 hypothetical protein [Gluconobacter cerinus]